MFTKTRGIKRVLLAKPTSTRIEGTEGKRAVFPLGIGYLVAVLEQTGKYEVGVLDATVEGVENEVELEPHVFRFGLREADIETRISQFQPDVVGISCLFSTQHEDAVSMARIAKRVSPDIVTVMGGSHPSALPEFVLRSPYVDYVIQGEAEASFPRLLDALGKGNGFESIDGLAYKYNGGIKVNRKREFIRELDSLPFPARHLFPFNLYMEEGRQHGVSSRSPFAQMVTSRGCPSKCIYCAKRVLWGNSYRIRSLPNVFDEIEFLAYKYGIKEIHFEDDNFTVSRKRVLEFCDEVLRRKLDMTWVAPNGVAVWTLDDEILEKMREVGFYSLGLAIESGSQDVLRRVKKPLDLSKVRPIVKKMKELGFYTKGFFMIGFPEETREEIEETIQLAEELELDAFSFFIATPLPGSEMFDYCIKKGLISEFQYNFTRNRYALSDVQMSNLTPYELEVLRKEVWLRIHFMDKNNHIRSDVDLPKALEEFEKAVYLLPDVKIFQDGLSQVQQMMRGKC